VQIPLQITFREVERSDAAEDLVRDRVAKLETFEPHIMACRVALEAAHRHKRKGKDYRVRVDLTVPGDEIVVGRDPPERTAHEDLYTAIDRAFDVAQRLLEDRARLRRGDVKTHVPPTTARVARLGHERGFGFLETPDGREVYFHRNSVLNDAFDRLEVGDTVRFVEEEGDKGPQASTVVPMR
jgi:ribosomal subunit interface protein